MSDTIKIGDIAPTEAEKEALGRLCQCGGCMWFRGALEAVIVHASQNGMKPSVMATNLAAVGGSTLGQIAEDGHASDFIDEVATRMKPFAELASRGAQAADLRDATEGATRQ